jgi:hypothetical protein
VNQLEISFGTPLRIVVAKEETPIYYRWTISDGKTTVTAKGDVMYTMPILYQVALQVSYVDAGGNPASVDTVTWNSSNSNIVTFTVDTTDQTKCTIQSTNTVGSSQITATADVDLGAGVKNIVSLLDVSVVAGEAVAGTINVVGTATPIP